MKKTKGRDWVECDIFDRPLMLQVGKFCALARLEIEVV